MTHLGVLETQETVSDEELETRKILSLAEARKRLFLSAIASYADGHETRAEDLCPEQIDEALREVQHTNPQWFDFQVVCSILEELK